MARAPVYQSSQRLGEGPRVMVQPTPVPQARHHDTGGAAVGQALSQLAQAGNSWLAMREQARMVTDEAERKTKLLLGVGELEKVGVNSQDYRTAPGAFVDGAQRLLMEQSEGIADPQRRASFTLWATSMIASSRGRVEGRALSREQDANVGGYMDRVPEYQRRVTAAGSPVERQAVIDAWHADIEGQHRAGWSSAREAAERRGQMQEHVGAAVLARTTEDRAALLNRLGRATDAGTVQEITAGIIRDGEDMLATSGLPPVQADAAIRAWRREAGEAGLRRLAAIDPEAARVAGGRFTPAGSFVDRVVGVESDGDPLARNENSTATGLGQFIERTWLQLMSQHRPELVTGRTREQVLALRTDPVLSREMVGRYAEQNAAVLRGRGLPINDANLYLAHFLGPEGAVSVLSVDPRTPVDRLLGSGAIAANRGVLEGRTAGDVAAWAQRKMGNAATPSEGPGDPLFAAVPFDKRVAILGAAEQSAAQAADHLAQQGDALRKAQAEEALKEAHSRSAAGELTGSFVEAIRPMISAAQYSSLLKMLGPDAAADDTEAMIDLVGRVDADDPQEFAKATADYLRRGKLKTATFLTLSERNRNARRDDQPASPYRSGRELVRTALDPGLLVTGAARGPFAAAQANALTEFDNWSQANPQADRAAALASAQDIVRRHETVNWDQAKIGAGLSRYFGGKGREGVTLDDVTAAEEALARDDEAGRMTPAEMLVEVRRLENWRAILEREQRGREAPRGRP